MITLRNDLVNMLRHGEKGRPTIGYATGADRRTQPEAAERPLLVRYFSTAFAFQDGQGYKIFGWFPDSSGALSDSGIDGLLFERIQQTPAEWDRGGPCAASPDQSAGPLHRATGAGS